MATDKKAKTTATKSSESKKIKELEQTISELRQMVQLLANNKTLENTGVDGERDVAFISLCNHILNLSTEPNGGGVIYTFNEFGEEQPIPYSDARKIIRNNKSFIKGGKCYIADDEIIKVEHLTNDYKKILNKDDLLKLLSEDREKFRSIFDAMTDIQKEIFRDVVADKLYKDKNSVDMNIVQYINDFFQTDILKNIEFGKEIFTQGN